MCDGGGAMRARAHGLLLVVTACAALAAERPYVVVDTGQETCYGPRGAISPPGVGEPLHGQDGQYAGPAPAYRDNGDDTISDLNTGLMWTRDPGPKVTWQPFLDGAAACRVGGYDDWRAPTIKDLYSLIDFRGITSWEIEGGRPFLDTRYFVFRYGDTSIGERVIDSQWCTSTAYVSPRAPFGGQVFGVNFADGRIKGYGTRRPGQAAEKTFYGLYVRGNPDYGRNNFVDNGDGTIADRATGLTWTRDDSGAFAAGPARDGRMNWEQALAWAEGLVFAGHDDWRLPNVKELQSIVDYDRSPDATDSPAISPLFSCTSLEKVGGWDDWGWYWSSTTHLDGPDAGGAGCYVAFGRAWGYMNGAWQDVHGAGAQRSDPKSGDPRQFPLGRGPQGDEIRIYNFARAVRGPEA